MGAAIVTVSLIAPAPLKTRGFVLKETMGPVALEEAAKFTESAADAVTVMLKKGAAPLGIPKFGETVGVVQGTPAPLKHVVFLLARVNSGTACAGKMFDRPTVVARKTSARREITL